jgi:energy-converting hydrogenase Eha subunit A
VIVATLAALLILPLVSLRGRTLIHCCAAELTLALFAWIVWRRLVPSPDVRLAFIAFAVLELAVFALFLARGSNVRWSANHAAIIAAVVYALTISATSWKVDGDEPFYLLITESIVHDADLDLANQYRDIRQTASGRADLIPHSDDPHGLHGERYSRYEPFLSLLMAPGYALGGLHGALAVIALFGVLLVRSTIRWMEDEGVPDESVRAVFPFFAFAPPVLFYATRVWPEVPAAFFFVEAIRGVRAQRGKRWVPVLLGLVMLKLRFVLVAIGLVAAGLRARRSRLLIAMVVLAIPLFVVWMITGSATNIHRWNELMPMQPMSYIRGFFGLLLDGMSGIAFQAPFYLFGLAALLRWKETPRGFRLGILASLLYILFLLPRQEAFGSYGPPLRYLVFLMPVLALGAAAIWERIPRGAIAIVAAWTIGMVIHGVTYPYALFHEANGENAAGEWLSRMYHADFSRLFPSFVRINGAAWIGALAIFLVLLWISLRPRWAESPPLQIAVFALILSMGFHFGRQPGARVDFEDAHVTRDGGHLEPPTGTANRAAYRGGWVLEQGQSVTFLARSGTHRLHVITGLGATIELGGHAYRIDPSVAHRTISVTIPENGPTTLKCVSGAINLDRMELVNFGVRQPQLPLSYATEPRANIQKRRLRPPHSKGSVAL